MKLLKSHLLTKLLKIVLLSYDEKQMYMVKTNVVIYVHTSNTLYLSIAGALISEHQGNYADIIFAGYESKKER
jgi:hypothetical protein